MHPDIEKEKDSDQYEWEKRWQVENNDKLEDQIGFIRKVFGIVAMQMLVTMSFAMAGSLLQDKVRPYFRHPLFIIFVLAGVIGCGFTIIFGVELRRKVPHNYFLLGGFTLAESLCFCALTSRMEPQAVVGAIMGLAVITTCIYIFTWNMKDCRNFQRQALKAVGTAVIIQLSLNFALIFMHFFVYKDREWMIWFSIAMIVLACFYLVWDLLYVIVPGIANKDDYIFAALQLYLDLAQIFYHLLILFGEKDK